MTKDQLTTLYRQAVWLLTYDLAEATQDLYNGLSRYSFLVPSARGKRTAAVCSLRLFFQRARDCGAEREVRRDLRQYFVTYQQHQGATLLRYPYGVRLVRKEAA